MASFYRQGNVVEKDILQSIQLLEKAAQLGEIQAMRDLVAIYEHGLGVEIDDAKADYWVEKAQAAEQDNL